MTASDLTLAGSSASSQASGPSRRRRPRVPASGVLRGIGIVLVLVVLLLPILWMLLASLRTTLEIVDPSRFLTAGFTLENYREVLSRYAFAPYILNSFIVAFASTAIALIIGTPAAFAISRFHVRNATAFLMLARVLPGVSLLVPWYFLFSTLGVVGGFPVLVGSHVFVTLPFVVAVMSGFFTNLPEELEESAQVDGLTRAGAFLRITVPLSVPGLATSAILAFIFSWNNFLFALVLSSQDTRTLPVAISNFTAYASVDWGGLMAAAVIITLPVILVALFAQKYVVSGLAAGATKG